MVDKKVAPLQLEMRYLHRSFLLYWDNSLVAHIKQQKAMKFLCRTCSCWNVSSWTASTYKNQKDAAHVTIKQVKTCKIKSQKSGNTLKQVKTR